MNRAPLLAGTCATPSRIVTGTYCSPSPPSIAMTAVIPSTSPVSVLDSTLSCWQPQSEPKRDAIPNHSGNDVSAVRKLNHNHHQPPLPQQQTTKQRGWSSYNNEADFSRKLHPGCCGTETGSSCFCCNNSDEDSRDEDMRECDDLADDWRHLDIHGLRQVMLPKVHRRRLNMETAKPGQRANSSSCGTTCRSIFRRILWTTLLLGSIVALVYSAADCINVYIGQYGNRKSWADSVSGLLTSFQTTGSQKRHQTSSQRLAAVTICNLSPLSCTAPKRHCSVANFTTTLTYMGNCFTIRPTASTVRIVLNAAGFEYTDSFGSSGRDTGTGLRIFFHEPEVRPTLPSETVRNVVVVTGTNAHVDVRLNDDVIMSSGHCEQSDCIMSCRNDVIERRCNCRPFWVKGGSQWKTCSMFQHVSCVAPLLDELSRFSLLAFDLSHCHCFQHTADVDPSCRDVELISGLDYSHYDLFPRHSTYISRYRRRLTRTSTSVTSSGTATVSSSSVVSSKMVSDISEWRCSAADHASRVYSDIYKTDADDMSKFVGVTSEFSSKLVSLSDNFRSARSEVISRASNLYWRVEFHIRSALMGVRRVFEAGFVTGFDELRERSLSPLVADCYETIADLERTVKQLTFTAASETLARKVLYYIADNQLSGKLETAIQPLDNLTKVYHAFINARPLPMTSYPVSAMYSSSPVGSFTPQTVLPTVTAPVSSRRYDSHLVPSTLLSAVQDLIRLHYAGMSENIAGLIENLLTLKSALKEVFQVSSSSSSSMSGGTGSAHMLSNETEFELARRAYIRRVQHVRRSSTLFQKDVIDFVRQALESRVDAIRRVNQTLSDAALSLVTALDNQLATLNLTSTPSSTLDNFRSFADACRLYLADSTVRKSSLSVPDKTISTLPLSRMAAEARHHGLELHRMWMRYVDAEKAVWKRLIRDDDDLLRGFYLAVRADVTDLIAMTSRSSSSQSGDNVDGHTAGLTFLLALIGEDFDETFSESVTKATGVAKTTASDQWYSRVNADLPAMDVDSNSAKLTAELAALGQSTDFDKIMDGVDHELLTAFDNLRINIETVKTECATADEHDIIRDNIVAVDIIQTGNEQRKHDDVIAERSHGQYYRLSSLFADLGGLMALFLGASAITCFELVDLVTRTCCRLVRCRCSHGNKKPPIISATPGGSQTKDNNHVMVYRSVVDDVDLDNDVILASLPNQAAKSKSGTAVDVHRNEKDDRSGHGQRHMVPCISRGPATCRSPPGGLSMQSRPLGSRISPPPPPSCVSAVTGNCRTVVVTSPSRTPEGTLSRRNATNSTDNGVARLGSMAPDAAMMSETDI